MMNRAFFIGLLVFASPLFAQEFKQTPLHYYPKSNPTLKIDFSNGISLERFRIECGSTKFVWDSASFAAKEIDFSADPRGQWIKQYGEDNPDATKEEADAAYDDYAEELAESEKQKIEQDAYWVQYVAEQEQALLAKVADVCK